MGKKCDYSKGCWGKTSCRKGISDWRYEDGWRAIKNRGMIGRGLKGIGERGCVREKREREREWE